MTLRFAHVRCGVTRPAPGADGPQVAPLTPPESPTGGDARAFRRRRAARWLVPLALVVVLALAPTAVGAWQARSEPAADAVPAAEVLARVQAARDTGWSGSAETQGGLQLPVTDVLSDLVDLAGSRTTVRAWWSDPLRWRVDQLSPVGEIDTVRDPLGSWRWDYQGNRAAYTERPADARVRLPQLVDLLPPTLGTRLLSEATPAEASRLPGRQIAGRDTLGLRIVPSEPQSTIAHVDVWADARTGVPLRVEVLGDGATLPAISSTFLDVALGAPDPARLAFTPPAGVDVSFAQEQPGDDLAATVDRYADVRTPATLGGLAASDRPGLGGVGVYGRGVTAMVAVPLRERFAGGLRSQLRDAARTPATGAAADGTVTLGVGPLNLLVTAPGPGGRFWLLAGTVTPATLTAAAADLVAAGLAA